MRRSSFLYKISMFYISIYTFYLNHRSQRCKLNWTWPTTLLQQEQMVTLLLQLTLSYPNFRYECYIVIVIFLFSVSAYNNLHFIICTCLLDYDIVIYDIYYSAWRGWGGVSESARANFKLTRVLPYLKSIDSSNNDHTLSIVWSRDLAFPWRFHRNPCFDKVFYSHLVCFSLIFDFNETFEYYVEFLPKSL